MVWQKCIIILNSYNIKLYKYIKQVLPIFLNPTGGLELEYFIYLTGAEELTLFKLV